MRGDEKMRGEDMDKGADACTPPSSILKPPSGTAVTRTDGARPLVAPGFIRADSMRLYRRRWLILLLFSVYSGSNSFQWIQYAIIQNVVSRFYGVSAFAVEWTSLVYMVAYVPLILPATWLLDHRGLRLTVLLGGAGTALGAWVKAASAAPERFWVGMVGQCLVGTSQIFILGVPTRLAAVWFGYSEVSTATAIGVFGNQVGVALGFVLPPMLVPNDDNVEQNLSIMFYSVAGFNTFILILLLLVFKDKPPLPPSAAQAAIVENMIAAELNFRHSMKSLMRNRGFLLLLLTYGINVGVYYAVSTLLNRTILFYFPHEEINAGRIGLVIIVSGLVGSVLCGVWLDKKKAYKQITLLIYIFSLIGMLAYTFLQLTHYLIVIFLVAAFLGFFMTGYLPIGFEFGAELTYPEPEGTSSGLLNASAQTFGIVMTVVAGRMMDGIHIMAGNLFMCVALSVGTLLTYFIQSDLRRHRITLSTSSQTSVPSVGPVDDDVFHDLMKGNQEQNGTLERSKVRFDV